MKGKIFNAQEVQSILNGSKVMFREVIKPCKQHPKSLCTKTRTAHYSIDFTENGLFWRPYGGSGLQPYPYVDGKLSNTISLDDYCPYKVGEEIFVKESFFEDLNYRKFAIFDENNDLLKINARYMKQEHSRITLEITDIKVERLQDISKEDAIKEGATFRPYCHGYANKDNGWSMDWSKVGKTLSESDVCLGSAQYAFGNFWNATHKKVEHKWEANPFVWVIDFKINK